MLRKLGIVAAVLLVAAFAAQALAGGKNLKYYPKDIPSEELQANMKLLKNSLGVQCGHCHVVVPKKQFDQDTPKKQAALTMLKMVDKLNKDLFTWENAPKATCYMCHRGEDKPKFKPEGKDELEKEKKFEEHCKEEKEAKVVKSMKELVEKINKNHFTWKGAPRATCWMCHRGENEPKVKAPE